MKKITILIILIIAVIVLGWYFYISYQISGPQSLSSTTTSTSTGDAVGSLIHVDGVRVKIGQPFSIPATATGTSALGANGQWSTYTSATQGFSFDYPQIMAAYTNRKDIRGLKSYLPLSSDAQAVLALVPSQYPASTTVHEAFVVAAATTTPDFAACMSAAQEAGAGGAGAATTTPVQVAIIPPGSNVTSPSASVDFYQLPSDLGGCWAGGCAFGTLFATYRSGTCYQFSLQAAVTDPGVYASSQAEFQQMNHNNQNFESQLTTLFYQILSTIRFQ